VLPAGYAANGSNVVDEDFRGNVSHHHRDNDHCEGGDMCTHDA
jgi:hypothetical protein